MSQQNPALKDVNGIMNSLIASLSSKQVINLNQPCPRLYDFKISLQVFFWLQGFLKISRPWLSSLAGDNYSSLGRSQAPHFNFTELRGYLSKQRLEKYYRLCWISRLLAIIHKQ